jgi:YD repeat-containing protein
MNCHDRSNFNQNPTKVSLSSKFKFLSRLMSTIVLKSKSFLSYAWKTLSTPASDEPQVRQRRDRSGQIYWLVYDPETNRSARLSSEQEVRQWLEQRFSQHRNL